MNILIDCLFLTTGHAHLLHEARWQDHSSISRWPRSCLPQKQATQLFSKRNSSVWPFRTISCQYSPGGNHKIYTTSEWTSVLGNMLASWAYLAYPKCSNRSSCWTSPKHSATILQQLTGNWSQTLDLVCSPHFPWRHELRSTTRLQKGPWPLWAVVTSTISPESTSP